MSKSADLNEMDTFWSGATWKTYVSDGQIRLWMDERFLDGRTEEANKHLANRVSMSQKRVVKNK
jgi:hypothetical protein